MNTQIIYNLNGCTVQIANGATGFTSPTSTVKERPDALGLKLAADFAAFFPFYLDRAFVFALNRIGRLQKYNHQEMLRKAALHADKLSRKGSMYAYKEMLEGVYNYYRKGEPAMFRHA